MAGREEESSNGPPSLLRSYGEAPASLTLLVRLAAREAKAGGGPCEIAMRTMFTL